MEEPHHGPPTLLLLPILLLLQPLRGVLLSPADAARGSSPFGGRSLDGRPAVDEKLAGHPESAWRGGREGSGPPQKKGIGEGKTHGRGLRYGCVT